MPKRAEQYIKDVLSGKKPAPKYVRAAVKRHVEDLEKSKKKNFEYTFSRQEAERAIQFIELNRFAENEKSDQPFVLLPWQAFIVFCAYGWRRKSDGKRRFVKAVIAVPRGNGKTELLAAIGNYALLAENERDPQIFWAATKKAQARLGWQRQKTMVERLRRDFPEVSAMCNTSAHAIYEINGMGSVKYMGRDSKTEDGFSPFYALIDEYHAWKDNERMNVLESGMVKRARPMTWIITTEGYERDMPWDELDGYCKHMLDGVVPQDELFAILFQPDKEDDWEDPKTWVKVNPSLGESVHFDQFETRYRQAKAQGLTTEIDFKIKNLNIKVRGGMGWVKDEHWQACGGPIDLEELKGKTCYGGIDLSSTFDFSSLCLMFPDEVNGDKYLWWNWLPEERFLQRAHKFPVFLDWERDGYISVVPGNAIDYEYIRNVVNDACKDFNVKVIGCDPANAWQLIGNLQSDGVNIEQYPMSWMKVSEPSKQFARKIASGEMHHGDNPVARWMIQNVKIKTDANGNLRPHKGDSTGNKNEACIDGIIAAIIAYGEYLTAKPTFDPLKAILKV